ncbi:MAG: DUF3817 domain-containing protein [Flavobacteriales bacterium]
MQQHLSSLRFLRLTGFIEGLSAITLFFVAMPLKYGWHMPLAVKYVGWVHGILFILFMVAIARMRMAAQWPLKQVGIAFLASLVPFGTFWADARYWKKEAKALEG